MIESNIDFEKYSDGLVPAIVQDPDTGRVLILGFMNAESLRITRQTEKVTFFSRSRGRIWTKGQASGNFLSVEEIVIDCDDDTLLIKARPAGPVCHTGADTCFNEPNDPTGFLFNLERLIRDRKHHPREGSYTSKLFAGGLNRIAQKVGEEAVELVIEAKDSNARQFRSEAADLIYHLLVLLAEKNIPLREVIEVLQERHR